MDVWSGVVWFTTDFLVQSFAHETLSVYIFDRYVNRVFVMMLALLGSSMSTMRHHNTVW